jgi:hypothetical protein
MVCEEIRQSLKALSSAIAFELEHPFFDRTIIGDGDTQNPVVVKQNQRDSFEHRSIAHWPHCKARFPSCFCNQPRGPLDILYQLTTHRGHPLLDLTSDRGCRAIASRQGVDILAKAPIRWNPAGGAVGTAQKATFFQFGHNVAHGCRRQTEPGVASNLLRGDRVARADVKFHYRTENGQRPPAQFHLKLLIDLRSIRPATSGWFIFE